MRVLGVDPGSRITGLGMVALEDGSLRCLGHQRIRMGSEPLPIRLGRIFQDVQQVITRFRPDAVAVEQVFISNNARSALILGQARGSAVCAAVNANLPVFEYSALQIKKSVVGTGSARKEQVQHMIRVLLGLTETPDTDEADALACAICHIHSQQVERKLKHSF